MKKVDKEFIEDFKEGVLVLGLGLFLGTVILPIGLFLRTVIL